MSKWVMINGNKVYEVIPEYALPVADFYGAEFAAKCIEAPDEVGQHWVHDPATGRFSEPRPIQPEEATDSMANLARQLETQNEQLTNIELALVELYERGMNR